MQNVNPLFDFALSQKATDIHICAGAPILLRIGKKLVPATEEKLTPDKSRELSYQMLSAEQIRMSSPSAKCATTKPSKSP